VGQVARTFISIADSIQCISKSHPNEILQSNILAQAAAIEDAILKARLSIIHLRRISNQLSPIVRLPLEILVGNIGVLLAQDAFPLSLLRISQSSHHIREAFLSCPWVWAKSTIKSTWHPSLVAAILGQTKEAPLQVSCNFASSRGIPGSDKILSSLQRWQSARLDVPSLPEFSASLTQVRFLPAPTLEELVISVPHRPLPTIVPDLFGGAAPNLRNIEFHNFAIHPTSPLWRNLHSLHLNVQHLWTAIPPSQLLSILAGCPDLQSFRLCDRMVGQTHLDEFDPNLFVELPSLVDMELAVIPSMLHVLLTAIKAPSIKRLETTTTFGPEPTEPTRQVLWAFFQSGASILRTLAGETVPPMARIGLQSSALQFFVSRGDWTLNCQFNCTDSEPLTLLFKEATDQCGARLPALVDFSWMIFKQDGINFNSILNCRSFGTRTITYSKTFQTHHLFSFLTERPSSQSECLCDQLETIGGDTLPGTSFVHALFNPPYRGCSSRDGSRIRQLRGVFVKAKEGNSIDCLKPGYEYATKPIPTGQIQCHRLGPTGDDEESVIYIINLYTSSYEYYYLLDLMV
ncbi:hypothetical protein FRB90_006688, partial [Tulasnella sp. 427]